MTILHLDSSINGDASASRALTRAIVDQLKGSNWGEAVIHRDLAAEPLPHLTLDLFADTRVLDEFLAADTVVIGAPMYNFTLPTPAQGVDRPDRHRRQDLPLHRKRPGRPGRRQARDHRSRPRRHLQRRLAGGRARASRDLFARSVQLHRHRARVRRRRRAQHQPRAARPMRSSRRSARRCGSPPDFDRGGFLLAAAKSLGALASPLPASAGALTRSRPATAGAQPGVAALGRRAPDCVDRPTNRGPECSEQHCSQQPYRPSRSQATANAGAGR